MPHPSPSNADSLKLQSLIQLGRRSGGRPQRSEQFTPGSYLLTVIHTTLAGIEPTTFRLLINKEIFKSWKRPLINLLFDII